jgi:hypothetical protein
MIRKILWTLLVAAIAMALRDRLLPPLIKFLNDLLTEVKDKAAQKVAEHDVLKKVDEDLEKFPEGWQIRERPYG